MLGPAGHWRQADGCRAVELRPSLRSVLSSHFCSAFDIMKETPQLPMGGGGGPTVNSAKTFTVR